MTRLLFIPLVLLAGCLQPVERHTLEYQSITVASRPGEVYVTGRTHVHYGAQHWVIPWLALCKEVEAHGGTDLECTALSPQGLDTQPRVAPDPEGGFKIHKPAGIFPSGDVGGWGL